MNNEIKVFENVEFGSVRTIDLNGVIYFVGKDVAEALGYANTRDAIARHVDEEDVVKHDTLTTQGIQKMLFINESGVYALIFGSKLSEAKKFKRWVTNEVLPSIRKTGGYNVDQSYQQLAERVERLEKMISQPLPQAKEPQRITLCTETNLKGGKLMIYSIIANDENAYNYTLRDFSNLTNLTQKNILRVLKNLVQEEYITKEVEYINKVKYCHYSIKKN